ncbi:MAG: DUF1573 domain-containing protein [Flavobacteriaceae bacterium]|jgi:hypothetical protein|nr:DUF1573 domain-containing protein [Flavobacteriaceae bacterium]
MNKITVVFFIIALTTFGVISCKKEKTSVGETVEVQEEEKEEGVRSASNTLDITKESIIKFDKETYDFKDIKKGEKVTQVIKFTNVGKRPLVISEVRPSCGCTTPKYTKKPVSPGKRGSITVTFDSSNFDGTVLKTVAVSGNFETKIIKFQAKINS